jgi:hypothetical protein
MNTYEPFDEDDVDDDVQAEDDGCEFKKMQKGDSADELLL